MKRATTVRSGRRRRDGWRRVSAMVDDAWVTCAEADALHGADRDAGGCGGGAEQRGRGWVVSRGAARVDDGARRLGAFVGVAQPRLSWQNLNDGQSAYEIVVGDGRRSVWDSGEVASPEQTDVAYGGPPLASNASYEWSVRVWDENGRASSWSRSAEFETALLSAADWSAKWIGRSAPATRPVLGQQAPAPLLRKEFTVGRDVASARLHVAGLGYYVAWIDGQRV